VALFRLTHASRKVQSNNRIRGNEKGMFDPSKNQGAANYHRIPLIQSVGSGGHSRLKNLQTLDGQ
jgi:hypothetical protein